MPHPASLRHSYFRRLQIRGDVPLASVSAENDNDEVFEHPKNAVSGPFTPLVPTRKGGRYKERRAEQAWPTSPASDPGEVPSSRRIRWSQSGDSIRTYSPDRKKPTQKVPPKAKKKRPSSDPPPPRTHPPDIEYIHPVSPVYEPYEPEPLPPRRTAKKKAPPPARKEYTSPKRTPVKQPRNDDYDQERRRRDEEARRQREEQARRRRLEDERRKRENEERMRRQREEERRRAEQQRTSRARPVERQRAEKIRGQQENRWQKEKKQQKKAVKMKAPTMRRAKSELNIKPRWNYVGDPTRKTFVNQQWKSDFPSDFDFR